MHHEIALDVLVPLLLLLLFSGRVVHQVQLLPVVDWQFLSHRHSERF
jgi:hypothetical protein